MKTDRIAATATGAGGLALLGGLSAFVGSASWGALVAVGFAALILVACAGLLWSIADLPVTPRTRLQSIQITTDNVCLCIVVSTAVGLCIGYLHPAMPVPGYALPAAFLLIPAVVLGLIRRRLRLLR